MRNPEVLRNAQARIRARNRAHIKAVRERLTCAHCGSTPVEFHRPEHKYKKYRQLSRMATGNWSTAEIDREIALCTPLCRTCHVRADRTGENNGYSKLRDKDIPVIRELLADGWMQKDIARSLGVSQSCISHISTGVSWLHIDKQRPVTGDVAITVQIKDKGR
jgi:hypothetical protein